MYQAKLTLEAIDQKEEAEQEDGFRNHLGASVIGKPCARENWYGYRWAIRERFTGQQLRLFKTGHLYEARFISYLRSIGCEVWDFDPLLTLNAGKPVQWRVSAHSEHFGGSLDALARGIPDLPPGKPFSASFKTHNRKSFDKLLDVGVMGSKFEHFIQEQIYMYLLPKDFEIDICLYMAVCKDTDRLHLEFIHFDKGIGETGYNKAADVIYSNTPLKRQGKSPGDWACKFCKFNRMCHFGDVVPERNCRTCRFSRPGANGLWQCGLRDIALDEAAQKAGCGSYQVNPMLEGIRE